MSVNKKYMKYLKGKKTYIVVAVTLLLGILEGFDIYEVPTSYWIVLTAAGFGFMRSGVNSVEKAIEDMRKKGK